MTARKEGKKDENIHTSKWKEAVSNKEDGRQDRYVEENFKEWKKTMEEKRKEVS